MRRIKLIYLLFISIALVGCDPGQILIIRVPNKSETSVTIFANKNILPFDKGNEKIVIQIPNNKLKPKYDTLFRYGLGAWREKTEIDYFVSNIDSIILRNTVNIEVFKDKDAIKNYLMKHRSGYLKSTLTIEAK